MTASPSTVSTGRPLPTPPTPPTSPPAVLRDPSCPTSTPGSTDRIAEVALHRLASTCRLTDPPPARVRQGATYHLRIVHQGARVQVLLDGNRIHAKEL
ncbi:hypothetical protein ACFXGT_32535 [Streptomyces sp. NPDC059352]|uniref:hypothetical protein n=1 Tax=Streptomyces sp. NPDC059352 TaxID=3346810 RepID=UPI00368B6F2A